MDEKLYQLARKIEEIVAVDMGKRGFVGLATMGGAVKAAEILEAGKNLLILTGFPISPSGVGENDGPIGAAAIAYAAQRTGRDWRILTDPHSFEAAAACVAALGLDREKVLSTGEQGMEKAMASKPDAVIAIERPGKGADGHFHGMRGNILDIMTTDIEALFDMGVPTIGIGDGGNELGMGNFAAHTAETVKNGTLVAAVKSSDAPLTAGVSNWWGWGLAALMSVIGGVDAMTTREQERACLEAAIAAGAVDGVLGVPAMSVDGIALGGIDIHDKIRKFLQ